MKIGSLVKQLSVLGWSTARLTLVAHFIASVLKLRTVNLARLAGAFDTDVQTDSNYKRLQRFFHFFEIDFDAIARLIARSLSPEPWILCMDRTNWQIGQTNVNILVLAVAYKGIAIPILWTFLDKKGNSNTDERIALVNRFRKLFGKQRIAYLTADREFRGKAWLRYLICKKIPFRVRIPNNTVVSNKYQNRQLPVSHLFRIKVGKEMILRQPRKIWGIPVYLGATRTPDEHVIVISNMYTPQLLADYKRRWEIETLFGCLKSRGFDMEQTRLRDPERQSKLLALLTLAFCWCYRTGEQCNEQKPIRRLNHGRPAYSLFRYGLDYLNKLLFSSSTMAMGKFLQALDLLFPKQPVSSPFLTKHS
jgi:hypothetical protein